MTGRIAPLPRFDGAAAWAALSPEQQTEIGAIALEYAICEYGFARIEQCGIPEAEGRPFAAGLGQLLFDLENTALDALSEPAIGNDNISVPIPSLIGPVCRLCGCSQNDACDGGCSWAEPDLCTACNAAEAA